jgi:predicted dehydrogenase
VDPSLCFASLQEAMGKVQCEAIVAPLRTEAHFSVVHEALEAGLHVLVEKPFTTTLEEAVILNALARKRGLLLMVSQNYRYFGAPIAAAGHLAARTIGHVDSVSLDFRRHGPSFGFRYYEIEDPLVADMSIHHFDGMRMLFGEVATVSCRSWNLPESPFKHHPATSASIEFESGLMLNYRASFMSMGEDTPWGGIWTANGSLGEMVWSYRNSAGSDPDWLAIRMARGELKQEELQIPRYRDRAGSVNAFAEAVAGRIATEGLPTGDDNIKSLAVVKACLLSARNNGASVRPSELILAAAAASSTKENA